MAPRETENNAYAKFWGDKQRALWYVMYFLEWSIQRPAASWLVRVIGRALHRYRNSQGFESRTSQIFYFIIFLSQAFFSQLQKLSI